MKKFFYSLLVMAMLASGVAFAQTGGGGKDNLQPPLPDPEKTSEWIMLHMHNTEKPYQGVDQIFGTTVDRDDVTMPKISDDDLFAKKFDLYLQENKADLDKKNIKYVRFVLDKQENLSKEQKEMLRNVAKTYDLSVRFEVIKIDWEGRLKTLIKQGETNLKGQIPDYVMEKWKKEGRDIDAEVAKSKQQYRAWWKGLYEKPTRRDWAMGTVKGVLTLGSTAAGWIYGGINPGHVIFWVLTIEHIGIELFFGPLQRTYMNFLYNKLRPKVGDFGLNLWGQALGFSMFFADLTLMWYAGFGDVAPWRDSVFWGGYLSMTFVGSLLGGFMPVGIYKLVQKGWMSRDASVTTVMSMDLLMPLEGVLMRFKFPYMMELFGLHQAAKYSIYLAGQLKGPKNTLVVMPKSIYESDQIKETFQFDKVPNSQIFRTKEKTLEFLRSKTIPNDAKLAFVEYVSSLLRNEKELIEQNKEFKGIVSDLIASMLTYVDENGTEIPQRIEDKKPEARLRNFFLKNPEDLESGYDVRVWRDFWKKGNIISPARSEIKRLKKELNVSKWMVDALLTMPISEYNFEMDETTQALLQKILLKGSLYQGKISVTGTFMEKTVLDYDFKISTQEDFDKWFVSLSEKDLKDRPWAFNKTLFEHGLLDWLYNDVSNPKRLQQIDYLLELARSNTKDYLTEAQKSKYELWANIYKSSQQQTDDIDGVKSFKERVSTYLQISNVKWNEDLKDSIMLEIVEAAIKKYDKLEADDIDVLLNGDKDNLSVTEYLTKKAKEGDAYAQYRAGILELVLTNNIDKMKFTYESKYKSFIEEADKYVIEVDSKDDRLDKLEKARNSVIDGRFEFAY